MIENKCYVEKLLTKTQLMTQWKNQYHKLAFSSEQLNIEIRVRSQHFVDFDQNLTYQKFVVEIFVSINPVQ